MRCVAVDDNEKRREVVRRKTAKYLMKAEKLHKKHLEGEDEAAPDGKRWDVSSNTQSWSVCCARRVECPVRYRLDS